MPALFQRPREPRAALCARPRSPPLPLASLSLSCVFLAGKAEVVKKSCVDTSELIRCYIPQIVAQTHLVHRSDLLDQRTAVSVRRGNVNVTTELAALRGRARYDGNSVAGTRKVVTAYDDSGTAVHDLITGGSAGRNTKEVDFSAFHKISPFRITSANRLAPVRVIVVK